MSMSERLLSASDVASSHSCLDSDDDAAAAAAVKLQYLLMPSAVSSEMSACVQKKSYMPLSSVQSLITAFPIMMPLKLMGTEEDLLSPAAWRRMAWASCGT
uniref:Uncharacterized protein n=1 Tax=Arundo donax TaxID=35708 RepID=A0A0A9EWW1_ARUDO